MKTDRVITLNDESRREAPSRPNVSNPVPRSIRFASSAPLAEQMPGVHHIELSLHDVDQLFNTMDPSPFHEKDLDDDAAEFILSWAQEFHRPEPVDLIVHLPDGPAKGSQRRCGPQECNPIPLFGSVEGCGKCSLLVRGSRPPYLSSDFVNQVKPVGRGTFTENHVIRLIMHHHGVLLQSTKVLRFQASEKRVLIDDIFQLLACRTLGF
jgi:hypothetical protein